MSKKKEYKEISTYDTHSIDIKSIMKVKNVSQNILAKMTRLSINPIRTYYHSNTNHVDLDVLSKLCNVLKCEVEDIIVIK